jgi:DNA-binding MarR family transcriptional regulator
LESPLGSFFNLLHASHKRDVALTGTTSNQPHAKHWLRLGAYLADFIRFFSKRPTPCIFYLTHGHAIVILVSTMNYHAENTVDGLLDYQAGKFEELMKELVDCCQERTAYISRKFGLPEAEVGCLMLFGTERYLTPKGISQKLDVAKSRATKILNGLIEKGLADHTDDVRDGRVKLISLTKKGKERAENIEAVSRGLHQKVLLELEPEQRNMMLSHLQMLRSSMEGVKKQLV